MKVKTILILLFIGAISCDALENENNELTYRWEEDGLVMENGTIDTMYYAVFEQEILAVIDWAAVSTLENAIAPNTFFRLEKAAIYEYEDGDNVVLYFWKGKGTEIESFQSVVIKT